MSSDELVAEGQGDTLGEAKWAAMKELETRFPGLTQDHVSFDVTEDGGTDGPARVRAEVDRDAWEAVADTIPEEATERVRAIVARVVNALGLHATVDIDETDEEIRATVNGDDLGLLIGKHGSTIDALQHLAWRIAVRESDERRRVVIDAAGYRDRRAAALQAQADQAVADALRFSRPVALDAMTASDRKVVHEYLRDRGDVETYSEGDEPDRHLVVAPLTP